MAEKGIFPVIIIQASDINILIELFISLFI